MNSDNCTVILFSGRQLDLRNPDLTNFTIEDFAIPLSREPRWRGNTAFPYSVAEHSDHTSYLVPRPFQLDALCHDLEEALTGDLIAPIKTLFGTEMVHAALRPLKKEIARHFGLAYPEPPVVHLADRVSLATEIRDLDAPYSGDHTLLPEPDYERIYRKTPEEACESFLARFYELAQLRQLALVR